MTAGNQMCASMEMWLLLRSMKRLTTFLLHLTLLISLWESLSVSFGTLLSTRGIPQDVKLSRTELARLHVNAATC